MDTLLTIAPFAIAALCIGGFVWLVRPDVLALLVWPVLLLYPKNLLFGALPMNAGLNDLFIVVVAARMLFYQSPNRAPSYRIGAPVVMLAFGMLAMQFFSEVAGAFHIGHYFLWYTAAKNTLKGFVFVSFTFILVKTITSEQDVRRHLIAFLVSLCVAFVLVWVCTWSVPAQHIWEVLSSQQINAGYGVVERTRTWGPFDSTAGLGVMIAAVIPLGVGLAASSGAGVIRRWAVLMIACAAGAEFITKTRSALTGIALVVLGWILLSKWRWRVILVLAVVGAAALLFANATGQTEKIEKRLELDQVVTDFQTRLKIWETVISNPSPFILACGEGQEATGIRNQAEPHNGFLDVLFMWGLGGVVMFGLLYGCTIRWARRTTRYDSSPLGVGMGWGVIWSIVSIAAASMTTDPWYVLDYRFLMYFVLAILWQRVETLRISAEPLETERADPYGRLAYSAPEYN